MAQKKYASLESLQIFKENSDNLYATQESVDNLSAVVASKLDANEYVVDDSLSSTSANPVQNKVLDAEFEAMSVAMNILEQGIDEKANASHTHNILDVTNLQPTIDEINDNISQKSQVQIITSDNLDNTIENLSTLKIHKLTQEQYDEAVLNGTLDDNAIYLTPDEDIDLSLYATIEQLNEKADKIHTHDDIYYTETEVDTLLADKSDISHGHDDKYDAKGAANDALALAKSYADTVSVNAANAAKDDLLNGAGEAYDTLKELGDLINDNIDAIDALEKVATSKADASHTHNDIYYTETEINEKISTINSSITASLSEAKSYSDTNLNTAKTYTDNAIAQRTQVQIITWEADD